MGKQNPDAEDEYTADPQEEYPGQNLYVNAAKLLQNMGITDQPVTPQSMYEGTFPDEADREEDASNEEDPGREDLNRESLNTEFANTESSNREDSEEEFAEDAYPEELYPRARTYNLDEEEMHRYTDDPRMLALSDEEFMNEFQGMGAGAMWAGSSRQEVDLSRLTEAEKIAWRIIHNGDDPDDYRALCEMANMLEEYEEADEGEELDRVIMQAAAVLGVNLMAL